MEKGTISVIVPIYNVESYLPACIDSILRQSYERLEVILVDDGSTDRSGRICDEYAARDPRVAVIHQPNGGVSEARNAGLKRARGEFIGFVDSDDWIEPDMYAELHAALIEHECEIAVCGFSFAYEDRTFRAEAGDGRARRLSQREALGLLLRDKPCPSYLWNKLYRAEAMRGICFPAGKTYEDVSMMHLIFENAQHIVLIPKPLYFYRQRSGSIIRIRELAIWMDCLGAWAERYRHYENDPELRTLVSERMLVIVGNAIDVLNASGLDRKARREKLADIMVCYDRCCRAQVGRFSKRRLRVLLYSRCPGLVRLWRRAHGGGPSEGNIYR